MSAVSVNKDHLKLISTNVKTGTENATAETVIAANEDHAHVKMLIEKQAKAVNPSKPMLSPMNSKTAEFLKVLIPPVFGILLFLGVWTLLSHQQPILPGPISTWHSAVELFSHPFHRNSLDDQGIGWNILSSLQRVGLGFGLAALVGIPLGFMIGRYEFMSRMTAPVISLLRPVSPLAWLPLGLLVMGAAGQPQSG